MTEGEFFAIGLWVLAIIVLLGGMLLQLGAIGRILTRIADKLEEK